MEGLVRYQVMIISGEVGTFASDGVSVEGKGRCAVLESKWNDRDATKRWRVSGRKRTLPSDGEFMEG